MIEPDKNIEIRTALTSVLSWMAMGVLLLVIVHSLFLQPYDLWPAVTAGGIAATCFLLVLILYTMRPPVPNYAKSIVLVIALLLLSMHWYSGIEQHEQSKWQRSQLMRIHSQIASGLATTTMGDSLLLCLRDYYAPSGTPRQSLREVFLARYPFAKEGGSLYTPIFPGDSLQVHILVLEPDSIVLSGRISYARGRDPKFVSYDGRVGVMEHRVTLTPGGLRHEFTN